MNDILKPGQTIQCEPSGMPCTIEVLLGAGGQGEVYKAELAGEAVVGERRGKPNTAWLSNERTIENNQVK